MEVVARLSTCYQGGTVFSSDRLCVCLSARVSVSPEPLETSRNFQGIIL